VTDDCFFIEVFALCWKNRWCGNFFVRLLRGMLRLSEPVSATAILCTVLMQTSEPECSAMPIAAISFTVFVCVPREFCSVFVFCFFVGESFYG